MNLLSNIIVEKVNAQNLFSFKGSFQNEENEQFSILSMQQNKFNDFEG